MTHTPHGARWYSQTIIWVAVYAILAVIWLILTLIFGGPITAGICPLAITAFIHFVIAKIVINKKYSEH